MTVAAAAIEGLEPRLTMAVTPTAPFVVIDAATGATKASGSGTLTIDAAAAKKATVRFDAPAGTKAAAVRFVYDNGAHVQVEQLQPYALFGDDMRGGYYGRSISTGTHTVQAQLYSTVAAAKNGALAPLATYTLRLTVRDATPTSKTLLYNTGPFAGDLGSAPAGFTAMINEGGGRYDSDLNTPGNQEDSFWVGGYYGPRGELIPAKLQAALNTYPVGATYVLDYETHLLDNRISSDRQIEYAMVWFRHVLTTAKSMRPDMKFGVYSLAPSRDYWTPTLYTNGMNSLAKYQRGETLNSQEFHWMSQVASPTGPNNTYVYDPNRPDSARFLSWQRANDRLTYGVRPDGSIDPNGGLVDVVDAVFPSLYDFYAGDDSAAFVEQSLNEARRIAGGKKVFGYLWPRYHDQAGGGLALQTIPLTEWRATVRRTLAGADGVVLWGADQAVHADHIRVLREEAAVMSNTNPRATAGPTAPTAQV